MKKLVGLAVVAAALWFAWPYYTLHKIGQAANGGNAEQLEQYVSWDKVRQGVKDDVNVVVAKSLAKASEGTQASPFAGLAAAFAPNIVNKIVDAYMTPAGLATLMRERKARLGAVSQGSAPPQTGEKKLGRENLRRAYFTGPTTFLVELGDKDGKEKDRLKLKLAFEGLGWKIVRIYLPLDGIALGAPQG